MSDSASQNELIAQFTGVTGVDTDRAKFFLESEGWNLDMAIASFYDDDGSNVDPEPVPAPAAVPQPAEDPQSRQTSRFGTIAGLSSGNREDSDEEEGEAYYAGGSDRGAGQQVLGPPKKKAGKKFVQEMFDSAKEHGAEEVSASGSSGEGSRGPGAAFRGMGFRLGDTESQPSESVMGLPRPSDAPREVHVVLKFWKNGFSIDDGPLRAFDDEANREFLESVKQGEIPRELIRLARGGEVNLDMEDHRTEEYVKPKVPVKAFTGEGYKLGSPAPTVVSASGSAAQSAASAQNSVNVDSAKPTTSLQIRLSDGTRMVAKFNHSHTISDVRTYITTAYPQFASVNFILMTTFPNKELTEETQTLEAAKLLNAVLVQRVK